MTNECWSNILGLVRSHGGPQPFGNIITRTAIRFAEVLQQGLDSLGHTAVVDANVHQRGSSRFIGPNTFKREFFCVPENLASAEAVIRLCRQGHGVLIHTRFA